LREQESAGSEIVRLGVLVSDIYGTVYVFFIAVSETLIPIIPALNAWQKQFSVLLGLVIACEQR